MMSLFDQSRLIELTPSGFRRSVNRLLLHCGFDEVADVDGPNDGGGDLIGWRGDETWVFQSKWKKSGAIGVEAVEEAKNGYLEYGAKRAAVVTSTHLSPQALQKIESYKSVGIEIFSWGGEELRGLFAQKASQRLPGRDLRNYQKIALNSIVNDLNSSRRALLYLATGLGKTVVTGAVIEWFLKQFPNKRILILAHARDLIYQIEKSIWQDLDKKTPTQIIDSEEKPNDLSGVTLATRQSIIKYIKGGYSPDFVIVDEAHHVGGEGEYSDIFSLLPNALRLGVTATPWRGDKFAISSIFGDPSYSLGIEEGMRDGYLAEVNYKLFCDNINWDLIEQASKHSYTIKDLNRRLFLPQRDQLVIDRLLDVWSTIEKPKAIVFCQTIAHAEQFCELLKRYSDWSNVAVLHSEIPKWDRRKALIKFRKSECPILVAVDILNEGVDVPDVNIICFARVTHSRRIFIQQLGRGLRISHGKKSVEVLDFVSDLRRIAAIIGLQERVKGKGTEFESLEVGNNRFEFSSNRAQEFMNEWVKDVASLETEDDETKLHFPSQMT